MNGNVNKNVTENDVRSQGQKKPIFASRVFKIVAASIGAVLILLLVFAGGVAVGLHKARFSERFAQNYERNFIGGHDHGFFGMMRDFPGRNFQNPHGLAGEVVSVTDNNLVIKDPDGKESTVTVSDQTIIRHRQDTLKITDIQQGNRVVVMGKPDDNGNVQADLIRVFENN